MSTNFEIIKSLLLPIAKAKLTASAHSAFLYLVWQQFGFPDKDGDQVGYGYLSKELRFSRQTMLTAIQDLVERNMLTKNSGHGRYGNTYHIITDTTRWNNQSASKVDLTTTSKAGLTTLVKQALPNNKGDSINKNTVNKRDTHSPKKPDSYGIGQKRRVNRINKDDPEKYVKGPYGHMVQR